MAQANEIKFNRNLKRKFHNLIEVPATVIARVGMLEDMEELFDVSMFSTSLSRSFHAVAYDTEANRVLGMKYLLGTWELIMENVREVLLRPRLNCSCARATNASSTA